MQCVSRKINELSEKEQNPINGGVYEIYYNVSYNKFNMTITKIN